VCALQVQFADDQLDLAGDKDLECMTPKLKETLEKWGLDMNLNKTKYLYTVLMYVNAQ